MKQLSTSFMLLAMALSLAGCSSKNIHNDTPVEIVVDATSNIDFGINLFKDVVRLEDDAKDVVISPLSASIALGMLAVGAQGETREQIVKILGLPGLKDDELLAYYHNLLAQADTTALSLANAVWSKYLLRSLYKKNIQSSFAANIERMDFIDLKKDAAAINKWTAEMTRNSITEIVKETDLTGADIVFENALYFQSQWRPDENFKVSKNHFKTINEKKDLRPFFGKNSYYYSYFDDSVSVVRIPYNDRFRFVVVLPNGDYKCCIQNLSQEKWTYWLKQSKWNAVELSIPCFDIKYKMDDVFRLALQERGMILPFTGLADFSKIRDLHLEIFKTIQKCAIKVNEKGTEAAAATVVIVGIGAPICIPDKQLIADHPFIYAIEDNTTGSLIMIGTHML